MENNLTTYQIYLILLGYLAERHDNTEMLKSMLVELYRRADKSENKGLKDNGKERSNLSVS